MKAILSIAFAAALFFSFESTYSQTNSSPAAECAIIFADSFLASFRNNDLDKYTNLSYPGVITYYGGNKNFREYIQRVRTLNNTASSDNIMLLQMVSDVAELQCVIQKTYQTIIDGRKARIISYIIGQSKDEGRSWTFFDVASNSPRNFSYIMPDMSDRLHVPQRQVVFEL